jgi:hypothetical protein
MIVAASDAMNYEVTADEYAIALRTSLMAISPLQTMQIVIRASAAPTTPAPRRDAQCLSPEGTTSIRYAGDIQKYPALDSEYVTGGGRWKTLAMQGRNGPASGRRL